MLSLDGVPTSSLFQVCNTPHSGRAAFATRSIPANTVIFRSDDLTLSVLLREYRREVCAQCFMYEHGRDLKIRDQAVGFAFCSEQCQVKWQADTGDVGIQAWTAVEKLVKLRSKEDSEMVDADLPRPSRKDITNAWNSVEAQANLIRIARQEFRVRVHLNGAAEVHTNGDVQVTKQHRKALQKALLNLINPDIMSFCVSGLLWIFNKPEERERVIRLAADPTPYHSVDDLRFFTTSYLHLLAIMPLPLLSLVTTENIFTLSSRDSHNSFGIRSLEDEGSEFFGYGCWPAASYFNHSCSPNVEKLRVGRTWEFRAGKDIEEGEEVCITYLSGEERKLSRGKRMGTLRKNWGFECQCERCEVVL
ncbi:hypothetical protein BCR34DRAFT_607141 [Clohesyomyces aquaticus]|uniref:SET domain-containing protein n=1 Tax=Clohesyomyces aquaticus TaxID=1231657 RepID=A0A1Y1YIJ5_9PLEO|nr:hypothetical protein BCR34DRAFT_607141 [Clohesyomyces aquaticus]